MSGFPHLGRYQIERLLGQGSYGSVYLAVDPQLQQQVVLKVLRDDLAADANTRQWFTREAKNLAQLSGVVHFEKVYNFFESHQPPYLVMEAVSGQTLEAYLAPGGRSVEEALPILQQIAAALDTAHKNGLLHGDLRAGAVLLQQNQSLNVIDFGLVKRTPSAEAMRDLPNAPAQSLFYIAPEQADANRRAEIAPATDIYAFGVIAYQMLTGRLPFEGHHEAILEGHRYHPPTDARFFNPNLPPSVEDALKKVLSKQPRERYVTAEAFVKALGGTHSSEAETRRRAVSPPPQSPANSARSYDLRGGNRQGSSTPTVHSGSDLPPTTPLDDRGGSGGAYNAPASASPRRNGFPIWPILALLLLLAIIGGGSYWWISGEQDGAPNESATATLSPPELSATATPALESVPTLPTIIASATIEQPANAATPTPIVITSPTEATSEAASPTVGEVPTEEATPTVGEVPSEEATPTVGEVPSEEATPTVGEVPTEEATPTILALPTLPPTLTPPDIATIIPLPTIEGIEIPTLPPLGTIELPSLP